MRQDLGELFSHFPVLRNRRKQKTSNLRGSEKQMLDISRALMGKPKTVLMDELTVGVRPQACKPLVMTKKSNILYSMGLGMGLPIMKM
jgi:branched-chain amino acid transport system ATP-binding protein